MSWRAWPDGESTSVDVMRHQRSASYGGQPSSSHKQGQQLPPASSLGDGFSDQHSGFDQLGPVSNPPASVRGHKKSASDTFAFAAGELLQQGPADLLQLLGNSPAVASPFSGITASTLQHQASAPPLVWQQHLPVMGASPAAGGAFGSAVGARMSDANSGAGMMEEDAAQLDAAVQQHVKDEPSAISAAAGRRQSEVGASTPGRRTHTRSLDTAEGAAAARAAATAAAEAAKPASKYGQSGSTQTRGNAFDTNQLDPRRAKRILANRQSAQRSRMKRLQYIHDLEQRASEVQSAARKAGQEAEALRSQQGQLQAGVQSAQSQVTELEHELACHEQLTSALRAEIAALQQHAQLLLQQPEQAQHHLQHLRTLQTLQRPPQPQHPPQQQQHLQQAQQPGQHVQPYQHSSSPVQASTVHVAGMGMLAAAQGLASDRAGRRTIVPMTSVPTPPMPELDVDLAGMLQDQASLLTDDMVADLDSSVDLKQLQSEYLEAGMEDFLEGLSSPSPDIARQTMSH